MSKEDVLAWLKRNVPHYECDDCWYSCATLCCDESRASDKCDCGADQENAMRRETLALLERPEERRTEWTPSELPGPGVHWTLVHAGEKIAMFYGDRLWIYEVPEQLPQHGK